MSSLSLLVGNCLSKHHWIREPEPTVVLPRESAYIASTWRRKRFRLVLHHGKGSRAAAYIAQLQVIRGHTTTRSYLLGERETLLQQQGLNYTAVGLGEMRWSAPPRELERFLESWYRHSMRALRAKTGLRIGDCLGCGEELALLECKHCGAGACSPQCAAMDEFNS